jgi:purine-binding chemotaxis protein CheW
MDPSTAAAPRALRDASREAALARAGEYLTWRVGDEEYGVEIQSVREIRGYEPPTRVPAAPCWVKGVVNLRGVIVPIVDLRLKLGAGRADYTALTVVIVLATRSRLVGVVVDAVSDVIDLATEAIRPPPQFGEAAQAGFITGIAAADQRMLMLVDMMRLLGDSLAEGGDAA